MKSVKRKINIKSKITVYNSVCVLFLHALYWGMGKSILKYALRQNSSTFMPLQNCALIPQTSFGLYLHVKMSILTK